MKLIIRITSRCSPLKIIDISGVSGQSVGAGGELRNRHEHPPDSLLPSGYGGLDRSVVRVLFIDLLKISLFYLDLLKTEGGNEEFGLQNLANIHRRNIRDTKSMKLKNTTGGKRRRNRKARKDKNKGKTLEKEQKNKKGQKKKIGKKNLKQNSCQTSSEVDSACIQVGELGPNVNQILLHLFNNIR